MDQGASGGDFDGCLRWKLQYSVPAVGEGQTRNSDGLRGFDDLAHAEGGQLALIDFC